jgi:predicted lipoprotein
MIASAPAANDARSEPVVVPRSALSSVAEDGYAACANAIDALERAIDAYVAGESMALHQLQRAAFELGELRPNLARLSMIADAKSA